MPLFFTVTMRRKVSITRFEGKARIERTEWIEETYRDLPYKTAEAYKNRFPEANVVITRQYSTASDKPSSKKRLRGEYVPGTDSVTVGGKAKSKPKKAAPAETPGSYAALVNEMVKDAA